MFYMVTAIRDTDDHEYGVEVAGIFDTEEKAIKAKNKVKNWMEEEEYEDSEVYIHPMNMNRLEWYDIEEDI